MAATLTDPLLGHLVDGRYEVLSRIARGGMATVYLATDRRLDREVALKVMHPHLAEGGAGSEFVARFRREARAAARLTHPGLVGVLDQGVDGETSYLTMEYVDGTNLRRHLGDQGALPLGEAFATAEAVLDALGAAHRAGLVHRDVKPENVLLAVDGRVKVADFGLARAVTEVTSTTTGTVLGTVAYLSPELVAHGTSDARTDVYAVGILLYEMITGRQPFTGSTPIQVAYQHVTSRVPPPSDVVPWLPVEVDELLGALTAREPDGRPSDAGAALEALRRTRAALDPATLDRRADVEPPTVPSVAPSVAETQARESTTSTPATGAVAVGRVAPVGSPGSEADASAKVPSEHHDPDATAALSVPRSGETREGRDAEAAGDELRRTMALQLGAVPRPEDPAGATAHPDSAPARRRRRLLVPLLAALVVVAALAGTAWWYVTAGPGAYTSVPAGLLGAELADAQETLAAAGLNNEPTEVFDPVVPAGAVVSTDPGEGERIREEGVVALAVSKGPDLRVVPPDLVGAPAADVVPQLTSAGFVVPEPQREHSDSVPADHVIWVSAEAGTELPVDSEVLVTVSDGPAPVAIPSLVGATRDQAEIDLAESGLLMEERQDFSEEYPAGVVMAQEPAPGTPGHRTDTVTITVSQGPPLVEVPQVVGMNIQAAQSRLEGLGLVVARENVLGGVLGVVRLQSVDPGQSVPKGSTVTLTVV